MARGLGLRVMVRVMVRVLGSFGFRIRVTVYLH